MNNLLTDKKVFPSFTGFCSFEFIALSDFIHENRFSLSDIAFFSWKITKIY